MYSQFLITDLVSKPFLVVECVIVEYVVRVTQFRGNAKFVVDVRKRCRH